MNTTTESKNQKCCICGEAFKGDDAKYGGRNPDPIVTDDDARCCEHCDVNIVIPARGFSGELNILNDIRFTVYAKERGKKRYGITGIFCELEGRGIEKFERSYIVTQSALNRLLKTDALIRIAFIKQYLLDKSTIKKAGYHSGLMYPDHDDVDELFNIAVGNNDVSKAFAKLRQQEKKMPDNIIQFPIPQPV